MKQLKIEILELPGYLRTSGLKQALSELLPGFLTVFLLAGLGILNQWVIWGGQGKFFKHLTWNLLGLIIFFVSVFFGDYKKIPYKLVLWIYGFLCFVLLIAKRRWIYIMGISIQPSEFLKPVLLILLSTIAASEGQYYLSGKKFYKCLGLVLFAMIMIVKTDLDYSFIIGVMCFVFLLFIGIEKRILKAMFLIFLLLAFVVVPIGWRKLKPHQKGRIYGYLYPEKYATTWAYQLNQALIAIGDGGLFGHGLKKGWSTRLNYLPAKDTDLAFAVWAETWGLTGVTLFLLLYGYLLWFGITISETAKDWLGKYMSLGVVLMFLWQLVFNVGGCSGLLPMTSIPLPFLSYGGSITISSYFLLSLLFNIGLKRHFFK